MKYILIITLLICSATTFADTEDTTWLYNEASLGFYDHDIIGVKFDSPSLSDPTKLQHLNNPADGVIGMYQRMFFHTQEHFSMYWGVSGARWAINNNPFGSVSGFVAFRYWPIRTTNVSPYVEASILGPSLITRYNLPGTDLGGNFLFENFLSIGVQLGHTHVFSIEASCMHYSSAGITKPNPGFNVPMALQLAYSF